MKDGRPPDDAEARADPATGDDAPSEPGAKPATPPRPEPEKAKTVEDHKVFVGTGFFWGLLVGLVLSAIVIILAAQNTDNVVVVFLEWEFTTPLIVVILVALFVGVVLDEIAGAIYRRRRRRILNERAELERLRAELDR